MDKIKSRQRRLWKWIAMVVPLLIFVTVVLREMGIIDISYYFRSTVSTFNGTPGNVFVNNEEPPGNLRIYLVDADKMDTDAMRDHLIREAHLSDSTGVQECWIIGYGYTSDFGLKIPLWKSGTERVHYRYQRGIKNQGPYCYGSCDFEWNGRVIGLCSIRHLRNEAFEHIVQGIIDESKEQVERHSMASR